MMTGIASGSWALVNFLLLRSSARRHWMNHHRYAEAWWLIALCPPGLGVAVWLILQSQGWERPTDSSRRDEIESGDWRCPASATCSSPNSIAFSILDPASRRCRTCSTSARQSSILLLLALPMTLIIMSEGLDLSMGAVLGLVGRRARHACSHTAAA